MKHGLRAISITLGAWSCGTAPATAPSPLAATLDAEERAVIAAVLDREMGTAPFIVVADSTDAPPVAAGWSPYVHGWAQVDPSALDEMLRDYTARNRLAAPLPPDLPTTRPAHVYPEREVLRFNQIDRFTELRRTFPGVRSFYWVSRPGFDAARRTAIVHTEVACQGMCGQTALVVLKRGAHGWRVEGAGVLMEV